jgi:hypothetical protein
MYLFFMLGRAPSRAPKFILPASAYGFSGSRYRREREAFVAQRAVGMTT